MPGRAALTASLVPRAARHTLIGLTAPRVLVRDLSAWVAAAPVWAKLGPPCLALLLGGTACLAGVPGVSTTTPVADRGGRTNIPIRLGKTIRADLAGVLTLAGEVRAKGQVAVIPRVTARLDKLYVEVGARVREGELLAELDRTELETQVLQAQAAQAAAEAKLAQLKATPRPEVVAQAQANLRAAQARLQALEAARASSDPAALQKRVEEARGRLQQLLSARSETQAVAQAENALSAARTRLNQLLADPARSGDRAAVAAAREEVRTAEEAAASARATVPSVETIEQARQDVQSAELALSLAQLSATAFDLDQARALVEAADAQVKLVGSPASPDEIKAAEAGAEQAFALAELARTRLRDATVAAPTAGVVTEIQATPGSVVGPTGPILTLIPPELQAVVQVEEGLAAQVQAGQAVAVSVESYPQDLFSGVVKSVAPVLDPRTRTVAVQVEVPDPQGKLRAGMFAQLAVQTGPRQGAVLVPKEAVLRLAGDGAGAPTQSVVYLVVENRLKRQRVLAGASDNRNVEILQGLSEGVDIVLNPRPDFVDGELVVGS